MIYRIPDTQPELAFVDPTSWVWDAEMGYRRDTEGLSIAYPIAIPPGGVLALVRKISCLVTLHDNVPSNAMGSSCIVAALSTGQTASLGAADWWASVSGIGMTRYYGLTHEIISGDLVNQAMEFEIPEGATVTAISLQSGSHAPYPPSMRGCKAISLHVPSDKQLGGRVRDLAALAAPRVRIFNWDLPHQFTDTAVAQDGTWSESESLPWGERHGVYYLSRDPRCPPIIHGPYTAE